MKRQDLTEFYTLAFKYTFQYEKDTVYFAYSVPYTYSDLRQDLQDIQACSIRASFCQTKVLAKSLAGEDCHLLTITSRTGDFSQRRGVVLTARVHPGETVSSWMMRGVLWFLTDPQNQEAKILRDHFIFKVVPMLNPDGVINGNYRVSLAGCDLNRRWKDPDHYLHPIIAATKRMARKLHEERGLALFCDLHGHSRKHNSFMYGCS